MLKKELGSSQKEDFCLQRDWNS